MYDRYSIYEPKVVLEERFRARFFYDDYRGRHIAGAVQQLPIILNEHPEHIVTATWGFVPPSAYDLPQVRLTLTVRGDAIGRLYEDSFARRRCLVLMNGWYVWDQTGDEPTLSYLTLTNGAPFACAGLWEPPSGRTRHLPRFALVTVGANALIAPLHECMPVILDHHTERTWISDTDYNDALAALITPFDAAALTLHQVSPQMHSSDGALPVIEAVGEKEREKIYI